MINSGNDDFNDDREKNGSWMRFWTKEFDGQPIWYIVAMAAVAIYLGMLISRLQYADAVLPWVLGFMIAGGTIMLITSFRRGNRR
jgi:hypothetical protein